MEFENLLTLIKAVSDSELTEFQYEENGTNIRFVKEQPQQIPVEVQAVPVPAAVQAVPAAGNGAADTAAEPEGMLVKSPLVGTFYAAPAEDADPFVSVGDTVKKDQPILVLEAMKMDSDITAPCDGVISFRVTKGMNVESDAVLAVIG